KEHRLHLVIARVCGDDAGRTDLRRHRRERAVAGPPRAGLDARSGLDGGLAHDKRDAEPLRERIRRLAVGVGLRTAEAMIDVRGSTTDGAHREAGISWFHPVNHAPDEHGSIPAPLTACFRPFSKT